MARRQRSDYRVMLAVPQGAGAHGYDWALVADDLTRNAATHLCWSQETRARVFRGYEIQYDNLKPWPETPATEKAS